MNRNGRRRCGRISHGFEFRDRGLRVQLVSRVVLALDLGRLDAIRDKTRLAP